MQRGIIPINQVFELEYRYYEKDPTYKYFNRRFEIYLIGKKGMQKIYILHMDNCDRRPGRWAPTRNCWRSIPITAPCMREKVPLFLGVMGGEAAHNTPKKATYPELTLR